MIVLMMSVSTLFWQGPKDEVVLVFLLRRGPSNELASKDVVKLRQSIACLSVMDAAGEVGNLPVYDLEIIELLFDVMDEQELSDNKLAAIRDRRCPSGSHDLGGCRS